MAWDKYFQYAGAEVINASRTAVYASALGLDWVKGVGTDIDISNYVGDAPYSTPASDPAPWYASNDPSTAGFAGIIPISITGLEDSSSSAEGFEFTSDGGNPGRIRHAMKEAVFSVALVGDSDCAVEAGFRWLKRTLMSHPCITGNTGPCRGEDLAFFSCEPDGGQWLSDYGRHLRRVIVADGPRVTGKRTIKGCPGATWTVQWTARIGDPYEYFEPVQVLSGLGSGDDPIVYGATYEWTGEPNASTSIKKVDGEVVATNLFTNPSFEAAGADIEVRRNYQPDPFFAYDGGGYVEASWPLGSASLDTNIYDTRGQSLRVDTTSAGTNNATSGTLITDPSESEVTARLRVRFDPTDEVGINRTIARIGGGAVAAQSFSTEVLGDEEWHEYTFTVPVTGTGSVALYLYGSLVAGVSRWFDAVSLQTGTTALLFDGDYSPDPDLAPEWTGTAGASESRLLGTIVADTASGAIAFQSSDWAKSGTKSLRITPTRANGDGSTETYTFVGGDASSGLRLGMQAGHTYTVSSTIRLSAPLQGTLAWQSRRIILYRRTGSDPYVAVSSETAPNTAGEHFVSLTFTLPEGTTDAGIRVYNGTDEGGGDVWWDDFIITEGSEVVPYFDGSTPDDATYGTSVFTAEECPVPVYSPIYDPECPALVTPPPPPDLTIGCGFTMEGAWDRSYAQIPTDLIPLWDEARPTIQITANDEENDVRNIRVAFYDSTFDPEDDCQGRVGEFRIAYIPAGTTLVIDAVTNSVLSVGEGGPPRPADSLILGGANVPPIWFGLSCNETYYITLEHDGEEDPDVTLDLFLTGRTA